MINHTYTLLLNRSPGPTNTYPLIDPGFIRLTVPTWLTGIEQALFTDCTTDTARQQRARGWLAYTVTPELTPYTLRFDPRNTYGDDPATLLSLCTVGVPIPVTPQRIHLLDTAIRLTTGLFTWDAYADELNGLRTTYFNRIDHALTYGAGILAYCYQLERIRR